MEQAFRYRRFSAEKSLMTCATLPKKPKAQGFTLIETLVVVAIVVILAGMAVPTFQESISDAEAASTRQELQRVRTAIEYYAFQHQNTRPGWDGAVWSTTNFQNQLLMATDLDGAWATVGTAGYPFGPYLSGTMPANPYNHFDTIALSPDSVSFPSADDSTGWVYFTDTGNFKANSTETTPDGTPVFQL